MAHSRFFRDPPRVTTDLPGSPFRRQLRRIYAGEDAPVATERKRMEIHDDELPPNAVWISREKGIFVINPPVRPLH